MHSNLKSLIEVHGTEIRITLKIKKKKQQKTFAYLQRKRDEN